ncbi:hypothetical protein HRbin40_00051 [bacterium HR40]|nr:hypothetical protein HRbin40_00051 [bacterium HR40]
MFGPALVLAAALSALWQPAAAAVVETAARLVSVELYPDGARLLRRAEIGLEAGVMRVRVTDLPEKLDPASLEVRLLPATAGAVLGVDVSTRVRASPVHERERQLTEEIAVLEAEAGLRRDRIEAARLQLEMLRQLARGQGERGARELVLGEARPEDWRKAWETLGTGALEIFTNIRDNERELRRLEAELEAKRRELAAVATGARAEGVVEFELAVREPGRAAVEILYGHPDAGFRTLYEAHLTSGEGIVELHRRAVLHQRTGEDWTGVEVVLASGPTLEPAAPPEPEPWFVDLVERLPTVPVGPRIQSEAKLAGMAASAIPETMPFAVRYRLPQPLDLPADGRERTVTLAIDQLPAELAVRSVPALDSGAYVTARLTYRGEVPLFPGELALYRDGLPAGRAHLPGLVPGSELRLGFGRDPAVAVERRLDTSLRSEEGVFGAYRRVERHYVTRIRNGHDRSMVIEVLDRLPVPQDERITVDLTAETTPPSARDVAGRRGVLLWRDLFAPGEERDIRLGFAVSFPKELGIDGLGDDG